MAARALDRTKLLRLGCLVLFACDPSDARPDRRTDVRAAKPRYVPNRCYGTAGIDLSEPGGAPLRPGTYSFDITASRGDRTAHRTARCTVGSTPQAFQCGTVHPTVRPVMIQRADGMHTYFRLEWPDPEMWLDKGKPAEGIDWLPTRVALEVTHASRTIVDAPNITFEIRPLESKAPNCETATKSHKLELDRD